jgi:flavin-dependent dehydrogenase
MIEKIDSIVIVGGGSSGWMTAATLCKLHPEKEITVIESPNHPIVGVGESTLLDIKFWTKLIGVSDKELLQATNGSYKMSIKFTDFYNKGDGGYHYPFVTDFYFKDSRDKGQDWLFKKALYPETPVQDFARTYVPHMALIENRKMSYNKNNDFDGFIFDRDVAFNFDATQFGLFLRDSVCIPNGVRLIQSEVVSAEFGEEGITNLNLSNGEQVSADLYIDCTGFKSLLLGEYLNEPFISFEDILPNNRAWAARVPYKNKDLEMESFANSTAIENGWCWNLPLWSRLGSGYVYSDKFVSKEEALEQFKNYLMSDKLVIPRTKEEVESLEFKDVPFRVGVHKRTWVKNVVAIGLSAGFIEPLESNGLYTVQQFLYFLLRVLQKERVNQFDVDVFNTSCRRTAVNFSQFIALHYALTTRTDTPYWKHQQSRTIDPSMLEGAYTDNIGFSDLEKRKSHLNVADLKQGISWISVGMRFFVLDEITQKFLEHSYAVNHKEMFDPFFKAQDVAKKRWQSAAEKELTHYEFLKKYIHNNDEL